MEQSETRRLPAFGEAPAEPVVDSYAVVPYFGTDIRVLDDGEVLLIDLEEFLSVASTIEQEDAAALGLVHQFLRRFIHPDDFRKFWELVRKNRQNLDQQMSFAKWVVEEMSGHPTPLLSDSSDGQQRTAPSSVGDSSSRVVERLAEQGRPDLALAVVHAQEHRQAADSA